MAGIIQRIPNNMYFSYSGKITDIVIKIIVLLFQIITGSIYFESLDVHAMRARSNSGLVNFPSSPKQKTPNKPTTKELEIC